MSPLESILESIGPLRVYSGIYWDPLEFILESLVPPWNLFWSLLRLLGRAPAVGARGPSLARTVQDSLRVYSGVYWTPLESILEPIGTSHTWTHTHMNQTHTVHTDTDTHTPHHTNE